MSILIAKQRNKQLTLLQVMLDEHGVCSFEYMLENTVESTVNIKEQFQLLAGSRYSFFGCWLYFSPLSQMYSSKPLLNTINKKCKPKQLFIYRDSLSAEDFSRLSQVIRNLKSFS